MITKHLSRLLALSALCFTSQAFANAYECGIAQGNAPATKATLNGTLHFTAGEYLGYAQEDAATNQLLAGIFHKPDATAPEQALAVGMTQLGGQNLYLVAYHGGQEIQVICNKK